MKHALIVGAGAGLSAHGVGEHALGGLLLGGRFSAELSVGSGSVGSQARVTMVTTAVVNAARARRRR